LGNLPRKAKKKTAPKNRGNMTRSIEVARKLADVMAIPMFILLILFLVQQQSQERDPIRDLLLFFAVVGLLADTLFTLNFFADLRKPKKRGECD
jgi:hypothetical protein